eukprot:7359044-Ditylum_brightwellii.AAC.1
MCCLTSKQKYAVVRQGFMKTSDMDMLGPTLEDVRNMFKTFNSLRDLCGGVNFGAIHYQCIFSLVTYAKDKKCHDQPADPAGFTAGVMNGYITQSQVEAKAEIADPKVPEPPKLAENNFHKWERAVCSILLTKNGAQGVLLAYMVRKDTTPTTFVDEKERITHEAKQHGP